MLNERPETFCKKFARKRITNNLKKKIENSSVFTYSRALKMKFYQPLCLPPIEYDSVALNIVASSMPFSIVYREVLYTIVQYKHQL